MTLDFKRSMLALLLTWQAEKGETPKKEEENKNKK